jgi:hypothetical protein
MAAAIRTLKKQAIKKRAEKEAQARQDAEDAEWTDNPVEAGGAHAPTPVLSIKTEEEVPPPQMRDALAGYAPTRDWPRRGRFWRYQPQMRAWYESSRIQIFVAVLIMLNFLCNVVEKEIDPQGVLGGQPDGVWRAFEHIFNAIFLVELLVNMYARWLWVFWTDGWNIFDFVVVAVGCIGFFTVLKGPLKLLRCLRAFRVFRLFKRIKSLNRIIVMIIAAIPGVTNAFLVIIIMISIYSLVAVEFFSTFGTVVNDEFYDPSVLAGGGGAGGGVGSPSAEFDPTITSIEITGFEGNTLTHANIGTGQPSNTYFSNATARTPSPSCAYLNAVGSVVPSASGRDLCLGAEYWGTFTRAWFTLFQILTGESWSEAIARPILFGWNDYGGLSIYISSIYFISFVLINAFILFNVFVAVLLDKVIQPEDELADTAKSPDPGATRGIDLYPWARGPLMSVDVTSTCSAPSSADARQSSRSSSRKSSTHGLVASPAASPARPPLSDEDSRFAEEMFLKYDRDGSGSIDHRELRGALSSMDISQAQALAALSRYDVDSTGALDLEEFKRLIGDIRRMPKTMPPLPKTPAKMLERLIEMQHTLLIEQRQRQDEAERSAEQLAAVLTRLDALEKAFGTSSGSGSAAQS